MAGLLAGALVAACGEPTKANQTSGDAMADQAAADATATADQPEALATDAGGDAPAAQDCAGALTEAQIGPDGGVVHVAGETLTVAKGALAKTIRICVFAGTAPPGATATGPVLRFEPSGTQFAVASTLTWRDTSGCDGGETACPKFSAFTSNDSGGWEQLWTWDAAAEGKLGHLIAISHFSTVFVGTAASGSYACCNPKSSATPTTACVSLSSTGVAACNPTLCTMQNGACPGDPPQPGCCTDNPTGPPNGVLCNSLTTWANCVAAQGSGKCAWNGACGSPTAPVPNCAICAKPMYASDPAFVGAQAQSYGSYTQQTCAALQAIAGPVPKVGPGGPNYPGVLGEWCGFLLALNAKCGANAGGCAPTATQQACSACTNASVTGQAPFVQAVQATLTAAAGKTCAQLAAMTVKPPVGTAMTPQFAADLGAWCAYQEALQNAKCTATTKAPMCAQGLCAATVNLCPPPPASCADCAAAITANNPAFASAYQYSAAQSQALNCAAATTAAAAPAPAVSTASTFLTDLGVWCGKQAMAHAICATSGPTTAGCALPLPPAVPPPPCSQCTDPQYTGNAAFASAAQQTYAGYAAMTCAQLTAAKAPTVLVPPSAPTYPGLLGEYCGFQFALNAKCGGSGTPAGCALPPAPPKPACPQECAKPVYTSTSQFQAAFTQSAASYGAVACPVLTQFPPPAILIKPGEPNYNGALGEQCGYFAALWKKCGAAAGGCPPATTCGDCNATQYTSDPAFGPAFDNSKAAYATSTCAALQAMATPAIQIAPGAPGYPGALGETCGFLVALQDKCGASSGLGCPPPDPPGAPCSACSSAANLGNAAFVSAAKTAMPAILGLTCAGLTAKPISAPSAAVGSASYLTQLAEWCDFQEALNLKACSPATGISATCAAGFCAKVSGLCPP